MGNTADDALLATLAERFAAHPERHAGIDWKVVRARLADRPAARRVLAAMEASGGEPDVIGIEADGGVVFCDCSAESPAGRRSLCFDRAALDGRRNAPPRGCASELAMQIGGELLDEAQYRALQQLGEFDRRTSSWLATPPAIRRLGGALFGDRRYDHVFVYHNGADAYFAARGFRLRLRV